jgi:hypothetical protein
MKNILYPFLFLLLTISCTSTDEISPEPEHYSPGTLVPSQVIGQWKLVKMMYRAQIAGQHPSPLRLPYEEILQLYPDSSIIRHRDGVKATGSFSIKTYPNTTEWQVLVKLDDPTVAFHTIGIGGYDKMYPQGMPLWNGEKEYLMNDASASDGPIVYYQKVPATK